MIDDINRLHIELDYGEVVNFNNRYFTLSATEENFKKHNKLLIGSYIALPCLLYTSPSPRDLSTSRMPSSA